MPSSPVAPIPEPRILFEDTHLLILSKPVGLLSQGDASGETHLVDWCRHYLGRNYVGLVHRLDRNTSGLMVLAKRSKAAERLTDSLRKGNLVRLYQALLFGRLPEQQEWRHFLKKDEATNTMSVVPETARDAKEARLQVIPLALYQEAKDATSFVTHAEFMLDTGRSHQIRVQAAAMGHPLLGDLKYDRQQQTKKFGMIRPALHSSQLRFPHPMSGEVLEFQDPLPSDLTGLLEKLERVPA